MAVDGRRFFKRERPNFALQYLRISLTAGKEGTWVFKKIYKILEIPFIYRLAMLILVPGANRLLKPVYNKFFNLQSGKVLDVGCGPSSGTTLPPQGWIVGVDINESYVRSFTGGFLDQDPQLVLNPPADRRYLGYLSSADRLPFPDASFDEARSRSFFHHMSDPEAAAVIREMSRCIRPGGRIITFDVVWPRRAWTRPFAWLICRFDRGAYVRSESQTLKLFQETCPGHWTWERHTYSYTGLEYLWLQYEKK
jgi:SAM-dependent methyltransferase